MGLNVTRVLLFAVLFSVAGCSTNWNDISTYRSSYGVADLNGKIKVGMPLDEAMDIVGGIPVSLGNGQWHFILRDGDLWVNAERGLDGVWRVGVWRFELILPEGGVRRFSSMDAESATPLTEPEHIDLTLDVSYCGKTQFGVFSYDIYSLYNMKVDFDMRGEGGMKGSFILLGGRYYLLKAEGVSEENAMAPLFSATLELRQLFFLLHASKKIGEELVLKLEDKEKPLRIPLPGARVFFFPAPWSAEGRMDSKTGKFDFAFGNWKFKKAGEGLKQSFSGQMLAKVKGRELPDDFSLEGWGAFAIGSGGPVPNGTYLSCF